MGSSFMRTSTCGVVLALAAITAPSAAHAQDTKQFEGVVTYRTDDGHTFEYAIRKGLVRIDMNADNQHSAMIMDPAARKMYMLSPEQKMYMEMDLSDLESAEDSSTTAQPVKTGKSEVVAGHRCEYWAVKEKKGNVDVCIARDLGSFVAFDNSAIGKASAWQKAIGKNSFPLKVIVHGDGDEDIAMVATKVEEKPLDASLFAPPSSYRKMTMPNRPQ